ncbi:MAG TPA: DUF6624 domain-containing protein, partial [bacterium]|nr:DUF6624 domain-containing protein [bacterium]
MDAALRNELLAMREEDLDVRERLAEDGSLFQGYHPEMEAIHLRNGRRLLEIVKTRGWPGRSLVGDDGAEAAWLIAHHALPLPELGRTALPLIQEAAAAGEALPMHAAMLEDRICLNEGRPQVYGTIYDWDEEGRMVPVPIANPAGLDARRVAVGLEPLGEDLGRRQAQGLEEFDSPPVDFEARQKEADAYYR